MSSQEARRAARVTDMGVLRRAVALLDPEPAVRDAEGTHMAATLRRTLADAEATHQQEA